MQTRRSFGPFEDWTTCYLFGFCYKRVCGVLNLTNFTIIFRISTFYPYSIHSRMASNNRINPWGNPWGIFIITYYYFIRNVLRKNDEKCINSIQYSIFISIMTCPPLETSFHNYKNLPS